jgi:HAD superfamily hydrolase (TIGR01509 family)
MKNIRAIGFDWGGVVFQTPGGSFNNEAAAFLEIDKEKFRQAYFQHNHMVNKGPDTKDYAGAVEMWSAILAELDLIHELDRFMEFIKNPPKGSVSQEMLDLVANLRGAGWKVGLFSNNSVSGAAEIRQQGYDKFFDAALFSADVDCMKPEPEALKKLADALGVSVTELVYIDDSERSLSTADTVGYTPILFINKETLIDQLKELGIQF